MTYEVRLTLAGRQDLEQLRLYLLETLSAARTREILIRIRDAFTTLSSFPERGARPSELRAVGNFDYRQIIIDRYRIVYRIDSELVLIFVIADGRRDMQSLLTKRLLSHT
jgi:toxin ParE1/3/4